MGYSESVRIDLLRKADLAGALQLQEPERWNQTAHDWTRLLRLNPDGCFAAFSDGKLIGTVTVITYGTHLAWLGMMLVAQEYRGRGIGKRLMRTALAYCQQRQIATVKLDATPAGRPLYDSLGFVPECEIERWQGTGCSKSQPHPGSCCTYKVPLSFYPFDEHAFRVSRKELLDALLEDVCFAPELQIDESTQSLQGYAFARAGARASYIGPVVAVKQELCVGLLDCMLQRLAGAVFVDICLGGEDMVSQLIGRGFAKQRGLTQMSLGQPIIRRSDMVFAIAGPELG
jgi:GNAT superfamily N-acetyltransferase